MAFTGDQILRIQNVQTKDVKTDLIPTPKISQKEIKQITSHKNPGIACVLSLIIFPGIGQFYNEQPSKGAAFFVAGLLGAVYYNEAPTGMGSLIFLGSWIFSGVDAYSSAKSINESLALSVTPNKISLCYKF